MNYRSKQDEIRDFLVLELINGKVCEGDKVQDMKFFTGKFKVNPSYVQGVLELMEKQGLVEKRIDYYYYKRDAEIISRLKDEFLNRFINSFLDDMAKVGYGLDEAVDFLKMRNMANG